LKGVHVLLVLFGIAFVAIWLEMAEESAFHRGGGEIVMAEIRGQCNGNATNALALERSHGRAREIPQLGGRELLALPAPASTARLAFMPVGPWSTAKSSSFR